MHIRVLSFLIAVPLLLLAAFSQLHVKTDISAFFISGESSQMKLLASQMQTGEISRRYLASIEQIKQGEHPLEFVEELTNALLKIDGVSRVWGQGISDDDMHALIAFYLPYRYHLYGLQSQKDMEEAFSIPAMQARATAIKQGLLGPQSVWLREIIKSDPMFFMSHSFGRISDTLKTNTTLSRYSPLVIETHASGLNTAKQGVIKEQIEKVFQQLNQTHASAYQLAMTGVPIFALTIKKQVEKDVTWISTVSISLMVLLFLMLFRSLKSLITVMLILLVSAAMASLVISFVFGEIYALTLALGTTLIGICVDYPIHTIVHAQANADKPIIAAKRIWPSLLLGAVTTVVGYAALSFTGFPGMQQIALYSAAGILTSLLISRFILPFSINTEQNSWQAGIYLQTWLDTVQRPYLRNATIVVALSSVLWVSFYGVQWQDDLSQLSPSVHALKEQDKEIRSRMQSVEPGRFILIHAKNIEEALQINEKVSLRLENLKEKGVLEAYYSVYPWLASEKLQKSNSQLAGEYLTDQSRQEWRNVLEKEGLQSAFFAKAEVPNVKPLNLEAVLNSSASRYIAGQYVQHDNEAILTIWLGSHKPELLRKAFLDDDQVQYVSQKDMVNEMNAVYRSKAVVALAYGALFILLLLALRYRSLTAALQVLLPAIISIALVVACWVLFGYPLSILHLLGLLLAVAICVDYGIFFYENRSGDISVTYQAIVMSALTTIAAFFCLALAENPALQVLAWTIAPGVLLGFLLCPVLIQKHAKD